MNSNSGIISNSIAPTTSNKMTLLKSLSAKIAYISIDKKNEIEMKDLAIEV